MKQLEHDRYVAIHSNGKNPPLFWVTPYSVQSLVIKEFGRDQRVYGLRGLKKDPNQVPLTMEQLAGCYIETIRSLDPHGPYALVGYCIAAAIAREIARQLVAQGETVRVLIMIAPPDPAKSGADLIQDPLTFKLRLTLNRLLFHLHQTKGYGARKRLSHFLDSMDRIRIRLSEKMSQRIYKACVNSGKPLPDQLQDSYHSSIQAFLNSAPQPYSGSAVVLQPAIKPKNAFDYENRRWAQLITGGLAIHEVPGDTDSMWSGPNAKQLAQKIHHYLQ